MFLDYDGTLSPIVDDPDRAFMSKQVGIYFFSVQLLFPFFFFFFYIVTEVCVGDKLDESNSEKACEIFSYCNSEWEMQRQGTF